MANAGSAGRTSASVALGAVLVLLATAPCVAAEESHTVIGELVVTWTVGAGHYVAFHFSIPAGKEASVGVGAESALDFYLMTASEFAAYEVPSSQHVYAEVSRENARQFVTNISQSGTILVVDNVAKSPTGADPAGAVHYSVQVTYRDAQNAAAAYVVWLFLIVAVLIASAGVFWVRNRIAVRGKPKPPVPPPP